MINENTEFFKIEDNLSKTTHIVSLPIIQSRLKHTPRVTIAIPTYRRPELLLEALESAFKQKDYEDYEVIVVDNESERNTKTELLLKNISNPKFSYYKNAENLKMSGNWNRCFELAKGDYVVLLHDDDILLPSFLIESLRVINSNPDIGVLKPLACNWKQSEDKEKLIANEVNFENKLQRLYDFSHFSTYMLGAPSGCFFRKEYLMKIGGFNQDFYPIMDFCFIVLFSQHYSVYLYFKTLSLYRVLVNDTLNLATLLGSFEGVYYLRKQLLSKYKVPRILVNQFLSCNMYVSIDSYKKVNEDFNYDIKALGLRIPNKIEKILYLYSIRILNKIIKTFSISNIKKQEVN